jgi:hypothetical protein
VSKNYVSVISKKKVGFDILFIVAGRSLIYRGKNKAPRI